MVTSRSWPPELDAPDTVRGRLQRGLGSVARDLVVGDASAVGEVLLSCWLPDPRWDTDLDARVEYYARLTARVGIAVAAIEQVVAESEPKDAEPLPEESLALGVLVRLVALGSPQAPGAVRRYVTWGRFWAEVINELVHDPWSGSAVADWRARVDGLAEIVCERFATVAEMTEAFDAASVDAGELPWSVWAAESRPIASALGGMTAGRRHDPGRARPPLGELTTIGLLAVDDVLLMRGVARELATRTGQHDVQAMFVAAEDRSSPMHAAAVYALAAQGRTDVLSALQALDDRLGRGVARGLLYRAFKALPYDATRSLATAWLSTGDRTRRSVAAATMARHAIADDVEQITTQLASELQAGAAGDQYVLCSLAEALGRHPAYGPYHLLERAFEEMPYSYGRRRVADAIAATDPSYPDRLAIDCLWDCEPDVRATGAAHAARDNPEAAARLAELRADANEDPDVRRAAT